MMEGETASARTMPDRVRQLLGEYEGLRRYDMLPRTGSAGAGGLPSVGVTHAGRAVAGAAAAGGPGRAGRSLPRGPPRPGPAAGRLCASATRGGCCSPRCRRSSCSRRSSSTPSRRSSSTPGLKPLMLRTPERDKHIVNVSAVEGQFYRRFKTTRHPHTNMAKAALNMMTRTSAADYQADGIHMNSVDTGWVSDEDPVRDRRAEDRRARLPPAARHRRRRRAHRRSDHRRLQHRRARLGPVPEGLPADRLVSRRSACSGRS